MKRLLIINSVLVALISCASMIPSYPTRDVVEIKGDKFDPAVTVTGISLIMDEKNPYNQYFLRSFVDRKSGAVMHQLYIRYRYWGSGWHYYNAAYTEDAQELAFERMFTDVQCTQYGCTYYETVGAMLPDGWIDDHTGGFAVKVNSKAGISFVVEVSSLQIGEQLRGLMSIKD